MLRIFFSTIAFWEICASSCECEETKRLNTIYYLPLDILLQRCIYVLCNVCDVIMCQCGMCLSYGRLFRTLAGNFQVQKWNANLCPKALGQCEHCTPNNDGLDLTEVWDKARSNTNTNTRTNEMCGNQGISKLKSQLSVNRKKKNLTFIPFHSIAVLRSSLFIN